MRHRTGNLLVLIVAYLAGFFLAAWCADVFLRVPHPGSWSAAPEAAGSIQGVLMLAPVLAGVPTLMLWYSVLTRRQARARGSTVASVYVSLAGATAAMGVLLGLMVVGRDAASSWLHEAGWGFVPVYLLWCPAVGCILAAVWLRTVRSAGRFEAERLALERELGDARELYERVTSERGYWFDSPRPSLRAGASESATAIDECRHSLEVLLEALEDRENASQWLVHRVRLHWQCALLCCLMGQVEDAVSQLGEMEELLPQVPPNGWTAGENREIWRSRNLFLAGELALVKHAPDRARACFEKALEIDQALGDTQAAERSRARLTLCEGSHAVP